MKVILIGDIFGKIGRKAVAEVLPAWKRKYKPDFVIANNDNLAHGKGITERTATEVLDSGIDVLTGGDHTLSAQGMDLLERTSLPILRPANFPPGVPGTGEIVLKKGDKKLLMISLVGRVFFHEDFDDPFRKLDEILKKHSKKKYTGIVVDFHSEATSEVNALGFYADGRISALVGTHTHIGTVDTRVLDNGTAFVSDIGAVIAVDSVLGENKEGIIHSFLYQQPFKHDPVETGLCNIGAVLVDIDEKTGKAKSIKRIDEEMMITA